MEEEEQAEGCKAEGEGRGAVRVGWGVREASRSLVEGEELELGEGVGEGVWLGDPPPSERDREGEGLSEPERLGDPEPEGLMDTLGEAEEEGVP